MSDSPSSINKVIKTLFGIENNEARIDRLADEFAGAFCPPASEQAMSAEKYPHTFSHPTAMAIKAEVDAWKTLGVTAIAAENSGVYEYIKQIEDENAALREEVMALYESMGRTR